MEELSRGEVLALVGEQQILIAQLQKTVLTERRLRAEAEAKLAEKENPIVAEAAAPDADAEVR